jgi:hypothetical protein
MMDDIGLGYDLGCKLHRAGVVAGYLVRSEEPVKSDFPVSVDVMDLHSSTGMNMDRCRLPPSLADLLVAARFSFAILH